MKAIPTFGRIRSLLNYDADTGVFTWREAAGRWGRIPAGSIAGTSNKKNGYREIWVDGRLYKAHRLAWLYMTCEWPKEEIDHINRIRDDNRFSNLRECSSAENMQNKNLYRSNTSGIAGVHWRKNCGKWQARIGVKGKRISLGHFDSPIEASNIYAEAKRKYHHFTNQEIA